MLLGGKGIYMRRILSYVFAAHVVSLKEAEGKVRGFSSLWNNVLVYSFHQMSVQAVFFSPESEALGPKH
jgi:hypothetical protein